MVQILSDSELGHYRDEGYLIPEFRLSELTLSDLREAVDLVVAKAGDTRPEYLINPHMVPWPDSQNPFLEAAREPRILDMVEQVLGPDLVLWICRILCKPALDGQEVPWHQDGAYWPIRPLSTCSIWIAIDPSTRENGCMRVIPRSHLSDTLYQHQTAERANLVLHREVSGDQFDESMAVDLELAPGQMSLHDVRMIHGSASNQSENRRAGLIFRYMPASSFFDRSLARSGDTKPKFDITEQPLFLMRGTDRSGRNNFTYGHQDWQAHMARTMCVA